MGERATQRLARLRGRGAAGLDSLFVETLDPVQALRQLEPREDPLADVQRVAFLAGVGRVQDARELRQQLAGTLPRGLAAAAEAVEIGQVPSSEAPLAAWLIRVQTWRETLGV
ncbi:MAG: hypothetical protein P1P84_08240 [Deferrisomatales bacterium]|nr:hypothetical protein [Deferrisomatales bacterium]